MQRAIKVFSIFTLLYTIAAAAQAQSRPIGIPNIPRPYIPPPPKFPQPNFPQPVVPHVQPPQVPVFVKRCMHCGHEVPASSCDGQRCPYCGVIWGSSAGISSSNTNGSATPNSPIAPLLAIGNDTIQSFAFAVECLGGILVAVGIGVGLWKWNQKRIAGGAGVHRANGVRSSSAANGSGRVQIQPPELPAILLPATEPPEIPVAAPAPAVSLSKTRWMYFVDGQQYGPVSDQELRQLAAAGKLAPTDQVWREGLEKWVPAAKLKGLFPSGGVRS